MTDKFDLHDATGSLAKAGEDPNACRGKKRRRSLSTARALGLLPLLTQAAARAAEAPHKDESGVGHKPDPQAPRQADDGHQDGPISGAHRAYKSNTTDHTPTIKGFAHLAHGEKLMVTIHGVTYVEGDGHLAYNHATGEWTLTVPDKDALVDGTYSVTVTVVDALGHPISSFDECVLTIYSDSHSAAALPLALLGEVSAAGLAIGIAGGGSSGGGGGHVPPPPPDITPPPAPTVVAQVTNDHTPLITGTADLGPSDTLRVTVNGITYSLGDGILLYNNTTNSWSLTVPDANAIPDGTYSVTAVAVDVAGNSAIDPTSNELVIASGGGGSSNHAPVASNDAFTTAEDTPATFDVRANDSDVDGDPLSVTQINGSAISTGGSVAVTGGQVTLNADGTLTFTPSANYNGTPSFTYTIADGHGGTATATVNGTVTAVPDPPTLVTDTVTVLENATTTFNILSNDSNPDGGTLTLIAINGSAISVGDAVLITGGSLALNADGTLTFGQSSFFDFLNPGDVGTTTFTYTVRNSEGLTSTITDTINVNGDYEYITGNNNNNNLNGTPWADYIQGLGGDDTIFGSLGADKLDGGTGTNNLDYSNSNAAVNVNLLTGLGFGGYAEGDQVMNFTRVYGSAFNDVLTGDNLTNALYGGNGADTLNGGDGNDWLEGGAGGDVLNGGNGIDIAAYTGATAAVTANLANPLVNTGDAAGDVYNSIEALAGSSFNDILIGDSGDNQIGGDAGDDYIVGGAGADMLTGWSGWDTVDYSTSPSGVNVVCFQNAVSHGGDAEGDVLNQIEQIIGSAFDDAIFLPFNSFVPGRTYIEVHGGDGNDYLAGGGGQGGGNLVKLYGDNGNDTLFFDNSANHYLDGGAGTDTLAVGGNLSTFTDLNTGIATSNGFTATLVSIENFAGFNGADVVVGDGNDNVFNGGLNNDILVGNGGTDTLIGGGGVDLLVGGEINYGDTGDPNAISGDTIVLLDGPNPTFSDGGLNSGGGGDTYILDTGFDRGGNGTENFQATIVFDAGDKIDLTDFRDSGNNVLDINDILSAAVTDPSGIRIDLSGFHGVNGEALTGSILIEGMGTNPASLVASEFIFSGGQDWQSQLAAAGVTTFTG